MRSQGNRRHFRNFWTQPRLALSYGLYAFLFSAVAAALVVVAAYSASRSVVFRILQEAGPEAAVLGPVIDDAMRTSLASSLWALPLLCGAALVLMALLIHPLVGPLVPLRRHVRELAQGNYGSRCRLRASDQDKLHELAEDLNQLAEALESQHQETPPQPLRVAASDGFSVIELLVVLATLAILAALSVSQFLMAYDRSRQRSTMADMRSVAAANGTFFVDSNEYAASLDDLVPYYFGLVPPVDRWGYAWSYSGGGPAYELRSTGADGLSGPPAPSPWDGNPYECDLAVQNGAFSEAPEI